MRQPQDRIISIEAAAAWHQALRDRGQDLVVTNGCFDVLHAGHIEALYEARREGDALAVLLNSDSSVRTLKGAGRPICTQAERAAMLAALRCVDAVVVFEGTDCAAELSDLAPDVYVKSAEYIATQNEAEKAALEKCGARVVWIARSAHSTSGIVERIRALDAAGGGLVVTPSGVLGEGERAEALTTSQEGERAEALTTSQEEVER